MRQIFLVMMAVCWSGTWALGDDQVRRIQEALRKRNLYFGQIDGRKTDETIGAIKRYQQRQGLPATGDVTPPTLTSLGVTRVEAGTLEWPEGPVLRSDAARELMESDRRALEEAAASEPEAIGESPASPPPVETPGVAPERPVTPERPVPPEAPVTTVPRATPAPPPPPAAGVAEATEFVRRYMIASATNRPADELAFYAKSVNYFDQGTVDLAFIARDMQRYYKHWPHRHYELLSCKISPLKPGEWLAVFRISFRYTNDNGQSAAGKSLNEFKIRQDSEGMHFTSMKEQVVRD